MSEAFDKAEITRWQHKWAAEEEANRLLRERVKELEEEILLLRAVLRRG